MPVRDYHQIKENRACSVFSFNKRYMDQKLKRDGKLKENMIIMPMCGAERLMGILTTKQTKQVEEYLNLLEQPKIAAKKDSALSWKKLTTELPFPVAVPVSNHILRLLGIHTVQEHASEGWDIVDWRRDLRRITRRTLSKFYGKDRLNPRLTNKQKHFAEYITGKLEKSYKWWLDFKLNKRDIKKIYETMVDLFFDRFLSNLTLQHAKKRNSALYDLLSSLRG